MKTATLMMITLLIAGVTVSADQPAGERPRIYVSEYWKDVIFCMMPGKYEYVPQRRIVSEPYGIAYELQSDGSMKMLYRTSGWYSHQVFVSMDAKYLVRMGPWNPGRELSKNHVAVEFYKNGKLLKGYSTIELVKDSRKIKRTTNHYFWRGETSKLESDNKFTLDTIDGIRYVFDATTGKIISNTKIKVRHQE